MLTKFCYSLRLFAFSFAAAVGLAQSDENNVFVRIVINADGSKTVYQTDAGHRQIIAIKTGTDGKIRSKIIYQLDRDGRYESGQILGPKSELLFKTHYEYDPTGRLWRETQLARDGSVRRRIVYAYDSAGHATGYAIYAEDGRMLRRGGMNKFSEGSLKPAHETFTR